MIGLDTSVLLRYILEDDPVWSESAARLIDSQCTAEHPGYINPLVLAEVVWTLRRRPDFHHDRIARLIQEFLDADNLVIGHVQAIEAALVSFRKTGAGFADCMIAALNSEAGAEPTFAIDKDAIRDKVFTALKKG